MAPWLWIFTGFGVKGTLEEALRCWGFITALCPMTSFLVLTSLECLRGSQPPGPPFETGTRVWVCGPNKGGRDFVSFLHLLVYYWTLALSLLKCEAVFYQMNCL